MFVNFLEGHVPGGRWAGVHCRLRLQAASERKVKQFLTVCFGQVHGELRNPQCIEQSCKLGILGCHTREHCDSQSQGKIAAPGT